MGQDEVGCGEKFENLLLGQGRRDFIRPSEVGCAQAPYRKATEGEGRPRNRARIANAPSAVVFDSVTPLAALHTLPEGAD
jgi:hypothetical protein